MEPAEGHDMHHNVCQLVARSTAINPPSMPAALEVQLEIYARKMIAH